MFERPAHIPQDFLELSLSVSIEFAGWRADRFVAHRISRLSRNKVQKIFKSYVFDENGKQIKANKFLKPGKKIFIYKEPPCEPEPRRDITILFEDQYYIAINKPPGLPVHPTARYYKNTLTYVLEEIFGKKERPVLTHRLDSETSGIVLCAKNIEAERAAKKLFADRKIKKQYLAIIKGHIEPGSGKIDFPISPDPQSIVKARMHCKDSNGLPSLTDYTTLKKYNKISLLKLFPHTGRQHQLRVHLSHMGYPILGDKLYGPDQDLFLDYINNGLTDEIILRAGHTRHALHSCRLELTHPFKNSPLIIESPMPEDMISLLEKI